jgi:hypothetical protein
LLKASRIRWKEECPSSWPWSILLTVGSCDLLLWPGMTRLRDLLWLLCRNGLSHCGIYSGVYDKGRPK